MTLEEQTISLAVSHARIASKQEDPQKFICEAAWCMLSLLHDQMEGKGEITGLRGIGHDKKLLYWTLACMGRPDGSKFKRVSISKALLMYDLINNHEAHH